MLSFKEYITEAEKTSVVFTFGRMNPPTKGHEALLDFCSKQKQKYNADFRVYVSHSQDSKKNPLTYEEKIWALKTGIPKYSSNIYNSPLKNPFEIVEKDLAGYEKIVFCVGEDRAADFGKGMKRYPNVEVVFIPRPPGAVSATMVREIAKHGDLREFMSMLSSGFRNNKDASIKLMNIIQKALK